MQCSVHGGCCSCFHFQLGTVSVHALLSCLLGTQLVAVHPSFGATSRVQKFALLQKLIQAFLQPVYHPPVRRPLTLVDVRQLPMLCYPRLQTFWTAQAA